MGWLQTLGHLLVTARAGQALHRGLAAALAVAVGNARHVAQHGFHFSREHHDVLVRDDA